MVNHPNRNAATVDTLRSHLVPVTKKIKQGEFTAISKIDGERLILVADWESRQILVTIVQGGYVPLRVQRGLDESFEVKYLFPLNRTLEEVIRFTPGEPGATGAQFNKLYQDHILGAALAAQEALENAPEDAGVGDEIKSQVRALLEPYRSQYEYE